MALVKIEKKKSAVKASAKTHRGKPPMGAFAKLEHNGSGIIIVLLATVVDEFKLKPGDKVSLYFDAARQRLAIEPDKNGDRVLGTHGNSDRRLKISVTKVFRDYIEDKILAEKDLPFTGPVSVKEGRLIFRLVPRKQREVRATTPVVQKQPVLTVPAPRRGRPPKSLTA